MAGAAAAFRSFCATHAPPGMDAATLQAPQDHSCPAYNDFTFFNDAMAHECPLSAHIRKVNPRLAITTDWINDSTAPNDVGGQDILIGQLPDPQAAERFFDVPPQIRDGRTSWVTPTGGAFLFAPSLTALKELDAFR